MKRILIITLMIVAMILTVSCQKDLLMAETPNTMPQFDIEQFEKALKDRGYNFEVIDVEEDFIPTARKRIILDNDAIDVYLFNSENDMEEEAKYIDSGGCSYINGPESVNVSWVSYPHFYKKGNLIVQYVGENEKIISDLKDILGKQFAGYTSEGNGKDSGVESSIDVPAIEQIIATLCSDEFEGRQTFSDGNKKAGEYIADVFDKIGLDPLSEDSYFQPYTKDDVINREDYNTSETAHNIVGYVKGKDSKKAIILSAHFDGRGIREGEIYRSALDNASGVAALIKIAEELKQISEENPFESNIIICAFNGEEQLYIGSTAFINQSKSQPWYENMYNINIDCIGAKDGGDLMFPNVSEYSAELYEGIKNSMEKNNIELVEFDRHIASDHRSFEIAGKANICIIQEDWLKWKHKPIDTPDILDYVQIEGIANALSDFVKNNDGKVY